MAHDVIMPKFGFTQETADIVRWLKQAGDLVEQGEPIAEVTTDKVDMEVEAPTSGVLDRLQYREGDTVQVTQVIAVIRGPDEVLADDAPAPHTAAVAPPSDAAEPAPATLRATPVAQKFAAQHAVDLRQVAGSGPGKRITREDVERHLAVAPAPPARNGGVRAVPAARRLAREHSIDLGALTGSGPHGRVQSVDVQAVATQPPVAAPPPPADAVDTNALQVRQIVALAGMRRTIATRLQRSAQDAPHIFFDAEIDVTEAEALRTRASQIAPDAPRVSMTALIAKVCAWALARHPLVNSHLGDDEIICFADVNIGIAVALDDGLVVPVVRAVAQKGMLQLASEIADLATRARERRLRPDDVQHGTFTISNLGMYGVDRFTAIINPPQSAILAVGRVRKQVVPNANDQPVVRPMMTVTLAADHRVIDGAIAAQFLGDLRRGLEQPDLLVL